MVIIAYYALVNLKLSDLARATKLQIISFLFPLPLPGTQRTIGPFISKPYQLDSGQYYNLVFWSCAATTQIYIINEVVTNNDRLNH